MYELGEKLSFKQYHSAFICYDLEKILYLLADKGAGLLPISLQHPEQI